MNTSSPLYALKRQAKTLRKKEQIPHHAALDRIAQTQGFERWSLLLNARTKSDSSATNVLAQLEPGDLLLLGARPGQGKTLMGLELWCKGAEQGRRGWFFTLEYNLSDLMGLLSHLGQEASQLGERFYFDNAECISANYISNPLQNETMGTLVVVDYLQLLDQKRVNAELQQQVRSLRTLAKDKGLIVVVISQIDRSLDTKADRFPALDDVHLPNPLDLSLFDKSCFLNDGVAKYSLNR